MSAIEPLGVPDSGEPIPAAGCVVIADSVHRVSEKLAREFKSIGWLVRFCDDRAGLIDLIVTMKPQVAAVELRLADGQSLSTIEWVKRLYPGVRLVIWTGHSSVATAVKCTRLGVDGYLSKPASADRILKAAYGVSDVIEDASPLQPNTLDRAVWEYINRAVASVGSISLAARWLGVDRRSLRRMLGKYAPTTR